MPYYIMEQDDRRKEMHIISNGFFGKDSADDFLKAIHDSGDGVNRNLFVSKMTSEAAQSLSGTCNRQCQSCEDWVIFDDFLVDADGGQDESRYCSDCRIRMQD